MESFALAKAPNAKSKKLQDEKTFRLGELFCGPGGLAFGAIQSKLANEGAKFSIKHAWASDYDHDSCDSYKENVCSDSPETVICKNVNELDIESLPPIDAFAYGFPCNDFSIVGESKGFDGHFGPLYLYGVKVLNYHKPIFFMAENVGGITSANEGKAFEQILFDLEHGGDGYNLTTNLYRFEEYGVPQTRHRIIIVGFAKNLNISFKVPEPFTENNPITAQSALESPPIPQNAANNELTNQSNTVVERLKNTLPGQNAWNADLPEHLKLNVKGAKLSQIYRRLHPNKPSYTITGSGGGGTHGYHWSDNRALTNRERARIQTFPDNFTFSGRKESVRKQIGMAVPPRISKFLFECILKSLAGISYSSVLPSYGVQQKLF